MEYLSLKKKLDDANLKLEEHNIRAQESCDRANALFSKTLKDRNILSIAFDYKTPESVPGGSAQTLFLSRGRYSLAIFGVTVYDTLNSKFCLRTKYIFTHVLQVFPQSWMVVQNVLDKILEKHLISGKHKAVLFRIDRCSGQNVNKYNVDWSGLMVLKFGIQKVSFVSADGGHNKFVQDQIFAHLHGLMKKNGVYSIDSLIQLCTANGFRAHKLDFVVDNRKFFDKNFLKTAATGIKNWNQFGAELDAEIAHEIREENKDNHENWKQLFGNNAKFTPELRSSSSIFGITIIDANGGSSLFRLGENETLVEAKLVENNRKIISVENRTFNDHNIIQYYWHMIKQSQLKILDHEILILFEIIYIPLLLDLNIH